MIQQNGGALNELHTLLLQPVAWTLRARGGPVEKRETLQLVGIGEGAGGGG